MANIVLRNAETTDVDAVYAFLCALSEKEYNREKFEEYYNTCLANDKNIYIIAEAEGKPVGFLSCHGQLLLHHAGWAYEIQEMFTDEAYRSHGIGKLMIEELEKRLSDITYDVLEVTSNNRRSRAHNFYLKNGFAQTHQKFTKKGNA